MSCFLFTGLEGSTRVSRPHNTLQLGKESHNALIKSVHGVCVCVWERERERDREEWWREKEREGSVLAWAREMGWRREVGGKDRTNVCTKSSSFFSPQTGAVLSRANSSYFAPFSFSKEHFDSTIQNVFKTILSESVSLFIYSCNYTCNKKTLKTKHLLRVVSLLHECEHG